MSLQVLFFALIATTAFAEDWQKCSVSCSDCTTCTSVSPVSATHKAVTLDTANCKPTTVSWLCCRGSTGGADASCQLSSCNGVPEGSKCNEVTKLTYVVPIDATAITIQLHDGSFAGTFVCAEKGDCCGGSASSCDSPSGVCQTTVSLSSCPVTQHPVPECSVDADCDALDGDCTVGVCSAGKCVEVLTPGRVCRPAAGPCDVEEVCVEGQVICPADVKKSAETVCRPAAVGADGTTCDSTEHCTGTTNECPADAFLAQGVACRASKDLCDLPETCSGTSIACPSDLRNDWAYTYKCATTQYLCGVTQGQLALGAGKGYFFGAEPYTCGVGTAREFVELAWPACLNQCINSLCPNGRGLSNFAEGHCVKSNGLWACDNKVDVVDSTPLPHCSVH